MIYQKEEILIKNILSVSVLMVLVLSLAGCAQSAPPDTSNDPWGLVLTAGEISPTGCRLTYTQSGGEPTGQLEYGREYHIEREEDGTWAKVPLILSGNAIVWTLEAVLIMPDSSQSEDVDWSGLYGTLPAGRYRVCKSITDFRQAGDYDKRDYYAEFEVE